MAMRQQATPATCGIAGLPQMATGAAAVPSASVVRRLKLWMRWRLSPQQERRLKQKTNRWTNALCAFAGRTTKPVVGADKIVVEHLQTGDCVRVRSQAEIEATLNHWRQLRGCTFMPEMARYCDSEQRVLKPLERFVDERDLRVKQAHGVVLLENVICLGTADFGRCDRSCFFFWREEWLERVA
jgi:hypothetical protein